MLKPRILLVIGGGIAAYKACELIRLIRKGGGSVTCVLTEAGEQFVTPMTLSALSENRVYSTLWDLKNEVEMGHIQLSREADLVVVCPATANLLAKMVAGISDDLATTLLLATDKPVLAVPAMNVRMWQHEATASNIDWLRKAGVAVMDPDEGEMACGEFGPGRLPEPDAVWQKICRLLGVVPSPSQATQKAPAREVVPNTAIGLDSLEEEPVSRHGLGSLFASIIPRSVSRKSVEEVEDFVPSSPDREDLPPALPDSEEPAIAASQDRPQSIEEEPPEFQPGGPLLAQKGSAKSAPPTDPEAINHEVANSTGAAEPEPVSGDVSEDGAVTESPLAGQPDFETSPEHRPLYGKHVLVTAGPTHEPIDPVRYIANRSSGKQGFAIAAAAAAAGARVTLVAGPVVLETPPGVDRIDIETAVEMADAVKRALPADAAVMVAAVADWRSGEVADVKMKKRRNAPPALRLVENPDILVNIAAGGKRPKLVVGFAAETDQVIENAKEKRTRKGCDWIVANDVSGDVMGGNENLVHIVTADNVESWEHLPKQEVAFRLVERIADALA